MKRVMVLIAFLPGVVLGGYCPDFSGTWKGKCDRDGVVKEESILIRQDSCKHINFYRVDYKIGMPYEQRYENNYEYMLNVFNLYWGNDGRSLHFNVDRVRWMKNQNIVSTGEGVGLITVNGNEMTYSRSYSSRNREGVYETKNRLCDFTKTPN